MSTVKNAAIVAFLLLAIVYLAYVNRKWLLNLILPKKNKEPEGKAKKTWNAMTDVSESFLLYADSFQGLFGTMYKASVDAISYERKRNVLMEWDIRMGSQTQVPIGLKSWWSTVIANIDTSSDKELQDSAQSVIEMIRLSGIVRDKQTEIVAAENTGIYYQHSEGAKWNVGQKLRIESPCWYLPSNPVRIIEKGYCEIL